MITKYKMSSDENNNISKTPEWLIPSYPPIQGHDVVGRACVEGQLINYPKVVRTMTDPPIVGQKMSCISFMLFKEPRKVSNGLPIYGYVKMRGNWADQTQATFEASKIIKDIDSKYPIRIAPTGAWLPITDNDTFIMDHLDVKTSNEEVMLRDEVVKEKQAEESRIKKELKERAEELKNDGDIYDDPTSLTYYSMRRVTETTLLDSYERQMSQLKSTKSIINKVQREMKKLEMSNPEYIDQWVDRYNEERKKGGVPLYTPSENQEELHRLDLEKISLESEERSDYSDCKISFFEQ
jgi:hypothetical protein